MANCIVCGAVLRTGRKYCFKHKSLAHEDYAKKLAVRERDEELLEEAKIAYSLHKLKLYDEKLVKREFLIRHTKLICILVGTISGILALIRLFSNDGVGFMFYFFIALASFTTIRIRSIIRDIKVKQDVKDAINERQSEYTDFVKTYIATFKKIERDEEDYKSNLFGK